ncbi:MAG TPA: hypothetical protein PKM43_07090 [Verrucomicrobiota bacterium]|nr:hypothetical protein [Verrucomicrobiota bacterium]HRZ38039.1 hypothetical protein [Candidatus Paceibacterota bacterium]HRZ56356.1 hypothetical protein [Candidatus Paceibacterota bacterium]
MQDSSDSIYNLDDFVPSLREALADQSLDLSDSTLMAAVPVRDGDPNEPPVPVELDRRLIPLVVGDNVCEWKVDSLRSLFRGDRKPPTLGDYPEAYNDEFFILEMHVLQISDLFGDRRDDEMREIYSILRRRPDGKSIGFVHDYMWQAAAILLGTRPLSQAEFEAILGRLERSCRTFSIGPGSRNYLETLRGMFQEEDS